MFRIALCPLMICFSTTHKRFQHHDTFSWYKEEGYRVDVYDKCLWFLVHNLNFMFRVRAWFMFYVHCFCFWYKFILFMSYVHGCFNGCFWYKFNLLLLLLFVFLTYYIFLWIRPNNTGIFDILFVEGFNGYVFAHIVCGSGSKPGGIWGAVFTIYVAIVGSCPSNPGSWISGITQPLLRGSGRSSLKHHTIFAVQENHVLINLELLNQKKQIINFLSRLANIKVLPTDTIGSVRMYFLIT